MHGVVVILLRFHKKQQQRVHFGHVKKIKVLVSSTTSFKPRK